MITATNCMNKYGDPKKESSMILQDVPTRLEIGVIPKKIYCNKDMVKPLECAFENLIKTGCVKELKTQDGVFNIRLTTAGKDQSLHSQGVALDLNAAQNGYNKPTTLSKEFVECFKKAGFDQGGNWNIKDGMHFQLATLDGGVLIKNSVNTTKNNDINNLMVKIDLLKSITVEIEVMLKSFQV